MIMSQLRGHCKICDDKKKPVEDALKEMKKACEAQEIDTI